MSKLTCLNDIKNVFYINLESRPDRKRYVQQQLKNIGIQNVERFNASMCSNIDLQATGKRALSKHYTTVLERCLRQIKSMDKEAYISLLENELAARKSRAAWDILCESDENSEPGP